MSFYVSNVLHMFHNFVQQTTVIGKIDFLEANEQNYNYSMLKNMIFEGLFSTVTIQIISAK